MDKQEQAMPPIEESTQPLPQETQETQETQEAPTNDFMNDPKIIAYIDSKVQEGIQKALQGTAPKANTVNPTEQERKQFEKMSYRERLKLFNANPQAYNKLIQRID